MTDYGSVFTALGNVVRASASPAQGWTAILDETGRHGAVPPELRAWNVEGDVARLRGEVSAVLQGEPLPPGTGFIYFGLFEAWDEETGDPVAGFYIAGGPDDDAELALAEGRLPYFPDARHFISPLLDAVHAAPERGDYDPTLMRYALEFAAAALLARHATQGLLDEYTLVVGFDDGDRDVIRRPENGGD
jgi:hypothetical protein